MLHRRRVFPLWWTNLRNEIRLVDLRWISGPRLLLEKSFIFLSFSQLTFLLGKESLFCILLPCFIFYSYHYYVHNFLRLQYILYHYYDKLLAFLSSVQLTDIHVSFSILPAACCLHVQDCIFLEWASLSSTSGIGCSCQFYCCCGRWLKMGKAHTYHRTVHRNKLLYVQFTSLLAYLLRIFPLLVFFFFIFISIHCCIMIGCNGIS